MNSIDERIVEMRFDNQQFESHAKQSMDTLDKLQNSLKLDGASKGIENVEKAANSFNMDGMMNAVESIKNHFSAFGIFADQIIRNIANSVVNVFNQAFGTLKQVSDFGQWSVGWDKYAEKTSSVQTIMAATAKEFTDTGKQMDYVNNQLDKLNWFTDETSYNFVDMVNNIGKFTSNAVKMDTAVTAMQGISTWAAISGANSQEAGRAMYNLSQAIAVGAVKLQDWKSIENANMATAEFKETVLQTAEAAGTLKRGVDGVLRTAKGEEATITNFNQTLQDGWFTSEVLLKSLDRYGAATNKLYELSELSGMTASDLLKALEDYKGGNTDLTEISEKTGVSVKELTSRFKELNSEEYELGLKAFRAAQEAKTFQEALSATSDAVSTGWMKTFELIFGDYEQAKKIWTGLANVLYDIFAEPGNTRNEILEEWVGEGGRESMLKTAANLFNALKKAIEPISEVLRTFIPPLTGKRLAELTKNFEKFTEKLMMSEDTAESIKDVLYSIGLVIHDFIITIKDLIGNIKLTIDESDQVKTIVKAIMNSFISLTNVLRGVIYVLRPIGSFLINLFKLTLGPLSKLASKISEIMGIFSKDKNYEGLNFLYHLGDSLDSGLGKALEYISIAFEHLGNAIDWVFPKLSDIKNAFSQLFDNIKNSDFAQILSKIGESFTKIFSGIKSAFSNGDNSFSVLDTITTVLTTFGNTIVKVVDAIFEGLTKFDIDKLFKDGLFATLVLWITNLVKKLGNPIDAITDLFSGASGTLDGIKGFFDSIKSSLESWQQSLKAGILLKIAAAIAILALSLTTLTGLDQDALTTSLGAITVLFIELFAAMKAFTSMSGDKGFKQLDSAGKAMIKLSASIWVLAQAVKALSSINDGDLVKGLFSVGAILFELGLFTKFVLADKKSIKSVKGILALSAAVYVLTLAVKSLTKLSDADLGKGLLGMFVLLAELAAFLKFAGDAKHVVSTSLALIVMAGAILIFAGALAAISLISDEGLVKALGGLGIALLEMAAAMALMKKGLKGAAAMLVMSAAIAIFVPALMLLSTVADDKLAKALLGLGAAFLILGVAGAIGNTVAAGVLAMAGALALAGIGLLAAGVGITMLSTGLLALGTAIKVAGPAIIEGITEMITAFASMIPVIATGVAQAIITFAQTIAEGAPIVAQSVLIVIVTIISFLISAIPLVVGGLMVLLVTLYNTIAEYLPVLIQAGINLMVSFIDGMAQGIEENTERIIGAISNLVKSIVIFALTALQELVSMIPVVGDDAANAIEGIKENIRGSMTPIEAQEIAAPFPQEMADTFTSYGGDFKDAGSIFPENLAEGITSGKGDVESASDDVADSAINPLDILPTEGDGAGLNFVSGLAGGISNNSILAEQASAAMASKVAQAARDKLKIESPSRVAIELGKFWDMGWANGIRQHSYLAENASEDMANRTTNALDSAMDKVMNFFNGDMDNNPVITPIVDLSNVESSASGISSMFGTNRSLSLAAASGSYSLTMDNIQEQMMTSINDKFNDLLDKMDNSNKQYTFETHVDLNGREIAKGSAQYLSSELNKIERNNLRREGVR